MPNNKVSKNSSSTNTPPIKRLYGALKGRITIAEGVDLTKPITANWIKADAKLDAGA